MANVFKPIRPKKISEEIVEQIKALISSGDLKPGEKIPSERELAVMLGVSRPSVREAIMVLDAMGLVEARQGGGTYVRSLTSAALNDPLTALVEENPQLLHSLVEVRMGLETWSAYLAAARATDSEIGQMRELLRIMEKQAARGGWDAEVDSQFHYAITAATHNTLQMHVLNTIHSLFHRTIQVALTEFYRKAGMVELLLAQHAAIFAAIAEKNPEKAREAMYRHIALVEEKMAQLQAESAAP
ncbi:FadR/GntR family transcriptional regulator [Geoalkalibacter sp.]|uniref:FadR/GntR family transcriptional regulator n=1 Tax=Geoalkalibacter sp. TaxID=3041440 RepID=UPI00272EC0CE|nr:FadR/GntR family transcriptional regulator [Geoalkalibacter sp.]